MERLNVGVDVSAEKLDVAVRGADGRLLRARFENNAKGHRALLQYLIKRSKSIRVVMEATGIYGVDLAFALEARPQVELMVANPRAVANFGAAMLQRLKTDTADAEMLLEFAERMPFTAWRRPSDAAFELRSVARRISGLQELVRIEKNRCHAADHLDALPSIVRQSIRKTVALITKEIEQLRAAALAVIKRDARLARRLELLLTVKGIGQVSGVQILAELCLLPDDMTERQWVAHAGLDPRLSESGTSVHAVPRISKRGNKYLRAALYLPAVGAGRFEANVKAFSNSLRQRGKKPLQVHVAIMRKLLHAIHAMFAKDEVFDGSRFFAAAAKSRGTAEIASPAISEVPALS